MPPLVPVPVPAPALVMSVTAKVIWASLNKFMGMASQAWAK